MSSVSKRNIFPMRDWNAFLREGKKEFDKLVEQRIESGHRKDDFEFLRTLGKGAFGRVMLAKMKDGGQVLAIKILEKETMAKSKTVKHALREQRILQSMNHPFTVHLVTSFQDNVYLYLGLPFIAGGEMFSHLRRMSRFPEGLTRFFGAQVVLAFEYLHYCNLAFRDLKPENILIDRRGYIRLTDFGLCKIVPGRTYSLCGTPEYLAPEVILSRGYGKSVDWWSFGVLLYEMAAGVPPFSGKNPMIIYEKVVACKYTIPQTFSQDLRSLITNLLQVDLSRRFGNLKDGVHDIKYHEWFRRLNWIALFNLQLPPPFVPSIQSGIDDFSNFGTYEEIGLKTSDENPYGTLFDDF